MLTQGRYNLRYFWLYDVKVGKVVSVSSVFRFHTIVEYISTFTERESTCDLVHSSSTEL